MSFTLNPTKQISVMNQKGGERKNFIFIDSIRTDQFLSFPDNGSTTVRFLPPWSAESIILKPMDTFWNKSDKDFSFCAPGAFGMYDPFKAVTMDIFSFGKDVWSKEYKTDLAVVNSQKHFYANVLQCPQRDAVKIVRIPVKLATQLEQILESGMYGNISDPETGIDIIVNTSGEKRNRTYIALPSPKPNSILGNAALDNLNNLDSIFAPPPEDVLIRSFLSCVFPKYIVSEKIKKELMRAYGVDYDRDRAKLMNEDADSTTSIPSENALPGTSVSPQGDTAVEDSGALTAETPTVAATTPEDIRERLAKARQRQAELEAEKSAE